MDEPQSPVPTDAAANDQADQPAFLRPTGLSAVELAARRGIGPLSPLAAEVWHGQARPCSSCGQLVRRKLKICDQCGQDLSPAMLAKMRAHSGPWYVLEHVRPFPGVSLERLVRQIRRGVLTRTTIVRGPTTDHQWRFAAETPVLCRYLGCCWACQAQVRETDTTCPECGVNLNTGTVPHQRASEGAGDAGLAELYKLSAALNASPVGHPAHRPAGPARVGRVPASWIIVGLVLVTLVAVFAVVRVRWGVTESQTSRQAVGEVAKPSPPAPVAPGTQAETTGETAETTAGHPGAADDAAPAGGVAPEAIPAAARPPNQGPDL